MFTNKQLLMPTDKKSFMKMVSLPTISLEAEEADQFIDYIVDESIMKDSVRYVKMAKETKNVRALGLGDNRFLYPGSTFTSGNYLKTLTDQKIPLTSKKMRGAVAIYDDDLEDNIEGNAFADHVMRMVTGKIANELEEIFWIGDTGSVGGFAATDTRSLFDGWRYRIVNSQGASGTYLTTHYNDVSGRATLMTALNHADWATTPGAASPVAQGVMCEPDAANGFIYICSVAGTTGAAHPVWPTTLGETVVDGTATWRCHAYDTVLHGYIAQQNAAAPYNWEFKYGQMLKRLPSKYKKVGMGNLRFFNSDQITQDYVDGLAARSTILGDSAILGKNPLQYGTVPIVSVPTMSVTMSAAAQAVLGGGAYGDCLLTPKGNLIIGIQRSIKIEAQRVAADEATYWFYSIRADCAIENVNACVLLERLTTA